MMDIETTRYLLDIKSWIHALPWQWIIAGTHIALASIASLHAMLYKRDPRAALGWVSVCLFFPLFGPLLYYMFGINRIETQARKLIKRKPFRLRVGYERGSVNSQPASDAEDMAAPRSVFIRIADRITSRPLQGGNLLDMLENGEQAYPAMLDAINGATQQVLLSTYLFESDAVGKEFVAALIAAHQRGVDVRVIVDGVGEIYSWPPVRWRLRRRGIAVARFLPPRLLPPSFSVNLRNHRKILVVDGATGFTGGMNITNSHLVNSHSDQLTADLHFRVQGSVVSQLQAIFAEDWNFVTGKELPQQKSIADPKGQAHCRCISDGPNEDLDKISLVMMGAISAAQHHVTIITPYFLPSREIIASLQSAALRGVDVAIILPQKSNLRFVDWATRNLLWELLQHDVRIYYQPAPFAHTKLFLIDAMYAQIGSANLDPRSLRLNFELNLEIIDTQFCTRLLNYAQTIRARSTEVSLQEVDARPLLSRIRDAACWLFMPYM